MSKCALEHIDQVTLWPPFNFSLFAVPVTQATVVTKVLPSFQVPFWCWDTYVVQLAQSGPAMWDTLAESTSHNKITDYCFCASHYIIALFAVNLHKQIKPKQLWKVKKYNFDINFANRPVVTVLYKVIWTVTLTYRVSLYRQRCWSITDGGIFGGTTRTRLRVMYKLQWVFTAWS